MASRPGWIYESDVVACIGARILGIHLHVKAQTSYSSIAN